MHTSASLAGSGNIDVVAMLSTILAGFSIVAALVLAIAYLFFLKDMQKSAIGKSACVALLAALAALQWMHLQNFVSGEPLLGTRPYVVLLMLAPTSFYFFSREVLLPGRSLSLWHVLNLVPVLLAISLAPAVAAPLAFLVGAGYTIWFLRIVFGMRRHVSRFRFELFFFGLFALLAVVTLVLVVIAPGGRADIFYLAYATSIGLGFALVVAALIAFPDLLQDITEVARLSYSTSTLGNVDVDATVERLEKLMTVDKLYAQENLNLAMTAAAVDLSQHQLSELINTRFGMGFSRYIREHRVEEAKRQLTADPRASVLSIGLAVGFRSQSNFYTAFREVTGIAPGAYRELQDTSE